MRRWLAIGLVCLVVVGCAGSLVGNRFRPDVYTVRSGDTLYSIAWRYRIDHEDLMRWNGIDNPRSLRVGQRLSLHPGGTAGSPSTSADAGASATGRDADRPGKARAGSGSATDSGDRGSAASAAKPQNNDRGATGEPPGHWQWPTRGTVVARFGERRAGGRGVDIGGEAGQPI
ncbi:MAG: LysM peptidoglycan-binding domain-containing protein, partial [Halofilum sp. (in: g-proteobacteria)]